jgi:hypothetical protein
MESFLEFFGRTNGRQEKWWTLENRNKKREMLMEGLITSYPFDALLTKLKSAFGDKIYDISRELFPNETNKSAGITFFTRKEFVTDDFVKKLEEILNVYGYFVGAMDDLDAEYGYFIEPKYPFVINPKNIKLSDCYHITHKKFLSKIQKQGLIPRKSQTNFTFEGHRIYLMLANDDQVIRKLGKQIAKSKKWDENDMVLLKVPNFRGLELYLDLNFNQVPNNIACFTYDNISPSNLKIIG